jgi:hypothetical protein
MKYPSILPLCGAALAGLFFLTKVDTQPNMHNSALSVAEQTGTNSLCFDDDEISRNLQLISSAQNSSQQINAQSRLIGNAKKSNECRKRIIRAVMKGMDDPRTDLSQDPPSFFLWHYGAEILSKLKAVEALDLLIAHLDVHDGTLFPLHHHPAVGAVIDIGSPALPKLEAVLRRSNDATSRQYAVFCITSIGGSYAQRILIAALPSESNPCVRSFITASLNALDGSSLQIAPDRQAKWYATFLCDAPSA